MFFHISCYKLPDSIQGHNSENYEKNNILKSREAFLLEVEEYNYCFNKKSRYRILINLCQKKILTAGAEQIQPAPLPLTDNYNLQILRGQTFILL